LGVSFKFVEFSTENRLALAIIGPIVLVLLTKAAKPLCGELLGSDRQHFIFFIFLSYGLKEVNHVGKKSNVFNLFGRIFGSFNCNILIVINVVAIKIIGMP
jgi:hypothetical protein